MAFILAVLLGGGLAYAYSRKGLFDGAAAFLSVLIAALAGLGFAAAVERMIEVQSAYRYSGTMLGIALFTFAIVRGALAFIDADVEFHPLVDRIGGAVAGLLTGPLVVGFLCVCLICSPLGANSKWRKQTVQASEMVLIPGRLVSRLVPGRRSLKLQFLEDPNSREPEKDADTAEDSAESDDPEMFDELETAEPSTDEESADDQDDY